MADFTIEGIIDVDASRGLRGLKKFDTALDKLIGKLSAVDKLIDDIDNSKIDVRIDSGGIANVREDLEKIKQLDADIEVDIEGDKALAEMQALRKEYEAMGVNLPVGFEDITDDVERLEAEIRSLGGVDIDVDLDGDIAIVKARALREKLDREMGKIEVEVDPDRNGWQELLAGINMNNAALGGVGRGGLIGGLVLLATTLAPITAVATGGVAALAASFTVLGTAIGALGVFAAPTISGISKAIKLLNTDTSDMSDEKLKEFNKQLRDMKKESPEIFKAAQGFKVLKENYESWADKLEPKVLEGFATGLSILNTLVGYMGPIALKSADGVNTLFDSMDRALKTDDWENFFSYVEENAAYFIETWGKAFGNFIQGFANLVVALDPLTKQFSDGFLGMSEDFLHWSQTLEDNEGFQNFLAYMEEWGPKVMSTIGGLIKFIIQFGQNIAPIGEKLLDLIDRFTTWYDKMNTLNPELTETVTQMVLLAGVLAPFAGLIGGILSPLGGLVKGFGDMIKMPLGGTASGISGVGGAAGGAAGGVGALATALGGFVVVGALVLGALAFLKRDTAEYDKMMESLKGAWERVVDVGEDVWEILKKLWEMLEDSGAIENMQSAIGNFADAFGALLPVLKPVVAILGGTLLTLLIGLSAVILALSWTVKGFWVAVDWTITKVHDAFVWLYDKLVGHSIIPDLVNGIIEWFAKLPGAIGGILAGFVLDVVGDFVGMSLSVLGKVGQMKNWVVDRFGDMKNGATNKAMELKTAVTTKWGELSSATQSKFNEIKNGANTKFSELKTGVTNKASEAKENVLDRFQKMRSGASEKIGQMKTEIVNKLSSLPGQLYRAGSSAIGSFIGGIRDRLSDLRGILSDVASTVAGAFHGSPVKWGPLKEWNRKSPGETMMERLAEGIRGDTSVERALKSISLGVDNDVQKNFKADPGAIGASAMVRAADAIGSTGSSGGSTTVINHYDIDVDVPVSANPVEVGRGIVEAIDAYESVGGRKDS